MTATKTLAVRSAVQADVDPLLELIQYAFRGGKENKSWTGEEHLVRGPRITRDKLVDLLNRQDSAVLICELVGAGGKAEIVGCIHVYKETATNAHIAMLAVDPDGQSAGVGSRLMRSVEDYARRNFGSKKMVGEVISGRPELMKWYERMGYQATGETAPFLGPEHGVTPLVEGLHFVLINKQI
jgi:ribosomal protein S18 acetylase RimI-like enzyme